MHEFIERGSFIICLRKEIYNAKLPAWIPRLVGTWYLQEQMKKLKSREITPVGLPPSQNADTSEDHELPESTCTFQLRSQEQTNAAQKQRWRELPESGFSSGYTKQSNPAEDVAQRRLREALVSCTLRY